MSNLNDPYREENFDIRKPIRKYIRYWYWFVISLSLAIGTAYFINKFSETVYRARATLLVRDDRLGGFRPGRVMEEMDLFHQRNNIFNEMEVLNSFSLTDSALRRMDVGVSYYNIGRIVGEIRTLEIYTHTPFLVKWEENDPPPYNTSFHVKIISEDTYEISVAPRGSLFRRNGGEMSVLDFGQTIEKEPFRFRLEKNHNFSMESHVGREYIFTVHNVSQLAHQYLAGIGVSPLNEEASIVQLSFDATNPQRAVDFLNTLMDVYLYQNLNDKNLIAQNTINFIEEQIGIISDSLYFAEVSLEEFRSRNQLMDVTSISQQLFEKLYQLDNSRAIEKVKRQYYDYLQEYIDNKKDFQEVFSPSALGIEDGGLNQLIAELSGMYAEMAQLKVRSTPDNPNVLMLKVRIDQSIKALDENLASIRNASDILLADIEQRINMVERRIATLPMTERELMGIKRRFILNESIYNYLMEKRAEAGIAMASNVPDHRIIDRARQTGIIAPQKGKNYTFALVLGFLVPLAFLVIRDFFDNKIYDKKDVTDAVNFPVLGIIPHNKRDALREQGNLLVFDENRSPATEAFRAMRTSLQYFASHKTNKVIAITSAISEEGKTFSAINLASVLAISGKRTVLIGGDLRKSAIHRDFGISKSPGLSNYLIGKSNIEEIIQKTGYSDYLDVIAGGPIPPNPSELIESERMGELIESLKRMYDFIVIDTPPVGIVPDGIHILKNSDIAVYIVRQGFSDKSSLDFLNELVKKIDAKNICIEINDVKPGRSIYEYGYGYAYGKYGSEKSATNNISKQAKDIFRRLFYKG